MASQCEDCDEDIDEGETLCEDCSERRYEQWLLHQDWLRMSDKEREHAIERELA